MKNVSIYELDKRRKGALPLYQYCYRKAQSLPVPLRFLCKYMAKLIAFLYSTEIPVSAQIGAGLYLGHPYGITINPHAVIGKNCNIHKGVTIGMENRGKRKGSPIIGDCVWIGVNSTIVGRITIGDDVLIAPNTFINQDIPSHSIVLGNPCIIKHRNNATDGYICDKI